LPVASTAKKTTSGQQPHSTVATRLALAAARKIPIRSASAAWMLGIAAYGLAANAIRPPACSGRG
jgi:hypothetical protein